jgi:hypothetical protein
MLPPQDRSLIASCCRRGPLLPPPSRRGWQSAAGALSVAVWVFMPKCPVCLAAHVALWTGLGLSLAQATLLRSSLLWVSGMLLFCILVTRVCMRWVHGKRLDTSTHRSDACCEDPPRISHE